MALAGLRQGLLDAAFNVVIGLKHGGSEVVTALSGLRRLK